MASIEEEVVEIIVEQLGVDKEQITLETSFINDDAAEKIQTVGQVVTYVKEHVG